MDDRFPQDPAADAAVTDYLVAYQERVASGETGHDSRITDTATPEALRERIDRAARCIDLLLAFKPVRNQRSAAPGPILSHNESGPSEPETNAAAGFATVATDQALVANEHQPAKPRQLGRFEIRSELGSGGFGIVYRAWDPRTAREVALKIPRIESLASPELQSRFEQEAEASARLDHPHIVPVLEAGVDGMLPYIASIYYPGVTLALWLRERTAPIAPRDAALLAAQLAEAADHAHAKGVLHRDIKPSNVLLSHAASEDQSVADAARFELKDSIAKLMDFGLAKLADGARDMTRSGAMLGTVRYMSPEQASGRTREIGAASDVYSLGAVLYELLMGQPPFASDSDVEVLRRVMSDDPTRIRVRRPDAPRDLETICAKCLEKEPAKRYASAGALAADLRRFLAGEPIHARRAGPAEIAWKWSRRRPTAAALIAVCAASLVAGVVGVAIYNETLRDAAHEAELQAAHAEELTREAQSQAARAEQLLYAGDVRAAQIALQKNRAPEAQTLLDRHQPATGGPDRREFCYGHLASALESKYVELPLHPGPVYSVAFGYDGEFVVTGCADGNLRFFTVPERKLFRTRFSHEGGVNEVVFSTDGKLLASGGEDGKISLRDSTHWREAASLGNNNGPITGLSFSPDGQYLISAAGSVIERWDLATGQVAECWSAPDNRRISEISRSADGKLLSVSLKGTTWILNANDLNAEAINHWKSGAMTSAFTKSGETLVIGLEDGTVDRHDVATEITVGSLSTVHSTQVKAVERSPGGNFLVTASRDASVQVFNTDSWTSAAVFRGHGDRVWDVDMSPTGNLVTSCDSAGRVLIWSLPGEPNAVVDDGRRQIDFDTMPEAMDFSPDGDQFAVGLKDGSVLLFDGATLATKGKLQVSSKAMRGICYDSTGARVMAVAEDGDFTEWETATGRQLRVGASQAKVHDARWDRRRGYVALADADQFEVSLWNWADFTLLGRGSTAAEPTTSISFMPDGNSLLVTQAGGGTLRQLGQLETATQFGEADNWMRGGANSSSGGVAYFAEWSKQIAARDLRSGKLLYRLTAHDGPVLVVAVSPDGRTLASGSEDGAIVLWDIASRRPALEFPNCRISVTTELRFSPDNKWLVLRNPQTARVWFWRSEIAHPAGNHADAAHEEQAGAN